MNKLLHAFACWVVGLGLVLASVVSTAQSGGLAALSEQQNPFLPVDEAYQLAVEIEGPQQLRLVWQIADDYYLYKHRFKVVLEDETGVVTGEIDFPPAIAKTDDYFGDVEVYYIDANLAFAADRPFGTAKLSVTSQGCADAGLCYPPQTEVFTVNPQAGVVDSGYDDPRPEPRAIVEVATQSSGTTTGVTLWTALLFAFLGGIILNAMPCVFPILSLKVLSFATGDPQKHHRQAWIYFSGVVASFVFVAAVLITLQNTGQAIGWGFQLQSPGFVIALAYLFTAMALSLSGLVEFGTGLMNAGSTLAGQGGSRGSFFTGVLAVVVASPCTAPFMGSALGFALTQPTAIALLVFVALGAGMASPMVLLSYSAHARNALPKPGKWMDTLKSLLAFPLYGTAVWLLWVAGKQAGVDTMALALAGLVTLALGLFLLSGHGLRRLLGIGFIVLAVALGTLRGTAPSQTSARLEGTVAWSPSTLAGLRDEGRAVFVDVTADWCITCLANEQAVLFTDDIRDAFERSGVVYMIADWTNYDVDIGNFVNSHGRNGIPLYVMYPADGGQPTLLPQLLTKQLVRDALAAAQLPP
ncbi:protein-disulfide reductase DsbD family protein [Luminiphilus syltensis]|nr:protein-disulfide reductase DsbD [Luminiphilus syltensis]